MGTVAQPMPHFDNLSYFFLSLSQGLRASIKDHVQMGWSKELQKKRIIKQTEKRQVQRPHDPRGENGNCFMPNCYIPVLILYKDTLCSLLKNSMSYHCLLQRNFPLWTKLVERLLFLTFPKSEMTSPSLSHTPVLLPFFYMKP